MHTLLLIFVMITSILSQNMTQVRNDFHELNSSEKVTDFIKKYKNNSLKESIPYVSAAIMKQAEYTFFPHQKLAYFNEGKGKLELYLKNNNECLEGRYVRVLVQKETPAFLGYKSNLSSDKLFIKKHISTSKLPKDFQKLILNKIK